jgi:hypothetical protein
MNQSTNLAYIALQIVLQYFMLPDSGWNSEACEYQIQTLRVEILTDQAKIFRDAADEGIEFLQQPEIISPYNYIEADEIERASGMYITALRGLFHKREDGEHRPNEVWSHFKIKSYRFMCRFTTFSVFIYVHRSSNETSIYVNLIICRIID